MKSTIAITIVIFVSILSVYRYISHIPNMKVYANHLKGVQVMATIILQCNSPSQIHSSVYFRLAIDTVDGRGLSNETCHELLSTAKGNAISILQ